jgi:hypothetical protein
MKRISAVFVLSSGLFIGFLCGALITTARSDQPKPNYDQVVAQVGDTIITRGDLAEQMLLMKGDRQSQLGLDVLSRDLQDRAIVKEVARVKGITVSDDEINQRIQEAFTVLPVPEMKQTPHAVLVDDFRTLILVEKMAGISVTEKDARDFYHTPRNGYLFAHPNMAKLVIISSKNRDHATEAFERMKDGEDAHDLSAALSDDADLKKKRGEVGWVLDKRLSPDLSNALFGKRPDGSEAMKPGQYTHVFPVSVPDPLPVVDTSKPQETPLRTSHTEYWVVYVEDIKLAYMPAYEQVKQAALCYARTQLYEKYAPEWFYEQAKAFNGKQSWKQVKDLGDLNAALSPVDIDLRKYKADAN